MCSIIYVQILQYPTIPQYDSKNSDPVTVVCCVSFFSSPIFRRQSQLNMKHGIEIKDQLSSENGVKIHTYVRTRKHVL